MLCSISLLLILQLHFVQNERRQHFNQDKRQEEQPAPLQHIPHSSSPSPSLLSQQSLSQHSHCAPHSQVNILFFIRLPKCASTSFVDLLQKLSQQLEFYLEFNPSGAYNWKEEEIISVSQQISRNRLLNRSLVYARHFYFIDFSKYEIGSFTYTTIMRDPIDRIVSSYLYYHFSTKKHIQNILNQEHRDESLSTCVQMEHEGCTHNLVTKYFCGHKYWCKNGDRRALETAKKNLMGHFAVVGIMEEMELSIRLMRQLLPQYFETGNADELILPALNRNERMASLSEWERQEITAANSADVELYEFAVQRLHEQALNCGVSL